MSNYWTLHIKNFARIREANIEAAPLVLFVGDNNSNKSYLLSLLWGLTHIFSPQLTRGESKSDRSGELQAMLDSRFSENPARELLIDKEMHQACIDEYNALLATNTDFFIRSIFNGNEIPVESLKITVPHSEDCYVSLSEISVTNSSVQDAQPSRQYYVSCQNVNIGFRDTAMFSRFYTALCLNPHLKTVFLPAPRTGYLLTYKTLAKEILSSHFGEVKQKNTEWLTSPHIYFLQNLIGLQPKTEPDRYVSIIGFIEENLIGGSIGITETPTADIFYQQTGLEHSLPLYLSSGVVSEVAGLLCMLKFGDFPPICIFEEPETCLHPALQRQMARVLIKMVNAGITVWASTHSVDMIQHVNNMIKLSNHPNSERLREEHGYHEDDVISPDKVRMYQFDVRDDKTDVTSLKYDVNGFPVPTFGDAIRASRKDVIAFLVDSQDSSQESIWKKREE
ncbi:MAG: AAA family ATPase [Planctomycetaceae bacterium]|nr:AAA family ATPase [Planctomycetaceae bacterium]